MAGAWLISKYGDRFDLLDKPDALGSHSSATPKGGAVGILAAFIWVSLFLKLPETFWIPAAILSIPKLIDFFGQQKSFWVGRIFLPQCDNEFNKNSKQYYQREKQQRYIWKCWRNVTFSLGLSALRCKPGHTRPLLFVFFCQLVIELKFKPGWGVDSGNWPIVDRT